MKLIKRIRIFILLTCFVLFFLSSCLPDPNEKLINTVYSEKSNWISDNIDMEFEFMPDANETKKHDFGRGKYSYITKDSPSGPERQVNVYFNGKFVNGDVTYNLFVYVGHGDFLCIEFYNEDKNEYIARLRLYIDIDNCNENSFEGVFKTENDIKIPIETKISFFRKTE